MRKIGTSVFGLRAPIIKEGDDLVTVIVDTVINSGIEIKDRDVIGITESIVARAAGNYVTVDEVAEEIKRVLGNPDQIELLYPIYSRNRFAMILKAFARAANKSIVVCMDDEDEVGNVAENHPFTGLNYREYYKSIIEAEGKKAIILRTGDSFMREGKSVTVDCRLFRTILKKRLESVGEKIFALDEFCIDKCEYGLYGSNKATEEKLKLFPAKKSSQELVENIQSYLYDKLGKKVEVMIYGDGCFKDPVGGIWEFADPVVSPAYTDGLEGTPNELKLKYLADNDFKDLSGEELNRAIKSEIVRKDSNLVGKMSSQGTTPRRLTDLLGSLMDLTSGSGDKGTPIVLVQGYFDNLTNE